MPRTRYSIDKIRTELVGNGNTRSEQLRLSQSAVQ